MDRSEKVFALEISDVLAETNYRRICTLSKTDPDLVTGHAYVLAVSSLVGKVAFV